MTLIRRIADFALAPVPAAVGFLIGGLVVFFGGFLLTQTRQDWFTVVEQGYSNFGIELISIAATVLVIDGLNQRRANKGRLQELITQMRSKDNALAIAAVEILLLKGWLTDGSLKGVLLGGASLEGAILVNANLEGAILGTDLQGVRLGANLQRAVLLNANLEGATLYGTNLEAANLMGANLQWASLGIANLEGAILRDAKFNEQTELPDGTKWTPDTDLTRFTNPNHANFWRSDSNWSPAYRGKTQGS